MALVHSLTPAPRRGDDPTPALRDADQLLRAAEALADSRLQAVVPCAGEGCRRPGTLSVVTADSTTRLCGMHAMAAVFTTPDLVALVKPEEWPALANP